jgi:hypothetical protein
MARYPDDPRPNTGYAFRSNWPTVSGGPEWAPQSRALTRFGLAEADLNYKAKAWAQIKTLYDFFESVNGSAGRFTFVDFNGIGPIGGTDPGVAWSGLYVAKGTGAAGTWDLPTFGLKSSPAPVVYENGVAKTTAVWISGSTTPSAGAYLIIPGTGTDGVDKLNAGTDPASTVLVTIDATCRRAMRRAKFTNVKNPFLFEVPAVYSAGPVNVVEVRK